MTSSRAFLQNARYVALVAACAWLVGASPAAAATVVRTVPGTFVFQHGQSPTDPGNCSAVVFVQWVDVPGTVSATARYDAMVNGSFGPQATTRPAPFDDTYTWVHTYTVAPGQHWIQISKGWRDGPGVDDCSGMEALQHQHLGTTATVDLTVSVPDPARIVQLARTALLSKVRTAAVAKVSCPAGPGCTVKAPRSAKVRIGTTTYVLGVSVPAKLSGAKSGLVVVTVPAAVAAALHGATVTPRVSVTATNTGAAAVTKVVARAIKIP